MNEEKQKRLEYIRSKIEQIPTSIEHLLWQKCLVETENCDDNSAFPEFPKQNPDGSWIH